MPLRAPGLRKVDLLISDIDSRQTKNRASLSLEFGHLGPSLPLKEAFALKERHHWFKRAPCLNGF